MDPDELARWAKKFSKKGIAGGVGEPPARGPERPPAHAQGGPPRVWGAPYQAPVRGSSWGGKPPELETLVKPGPSAYADILAQVPELAPNMAGADAMDGSMSAEAEAARREGLSGLEGADPGVRPGEDGAPRGYRGGGAQAPIVPLADLQKPN